MVLKKETEIIIQSLFHYMISINYSSSFDSSVACSFIKAV